MKISSWYHLRSTPLPLSHESKRMPATTHAYLIKKQENIIFLIIVFIHIQIYRFMTQSNNQLDFIIDSPSYYLFSNQLDFIIDRPSYYLCFSSLVCKLSLSTESCCKIHLHDAISIYN